MNWESGLRKGGLFFIFLGLALLLATPFLMPGFLALGRRWVSPDGWISPTGEENLRLTCWALAGTLVVLGVLLRWLPRLVGRPSWRELLAVWFADEPPPAPSRFQILRFCLIFCLTATIAYAALHTVPFFEEEDGVFETLQVLLFAGAAGILIKGGREKGAGSGIRRFHLAMGILFLVVALEEASWGQRIFGWETPDSWRELNWQEETNLHNLFNGVFHGIYLGTGLLLVLSTFGAGWLRVCGFWKEITEKVLPHPALLPAAFLILSFNLYPLLGALFPWQELQELVASLAALLYARSVTGWNPHPEKLSARSRSLPIRS